MKNSLSAVPRYLIAALVVLAAGFGGFHLYEKSRPQPSLTPLPDASPDVDPAAAQPAAAETRKPIPDVLPAFSLVDREGKRRELASFAGRPLMVNFWATWCAPCVREIPLLNKIRAQRQAQNAEIVGIAVDFRDDVVKFAQKVPINYPLLIGEEDGLSAAEAFGMGMAFPFSVFSDSKNRILTVKIGELHEDEANFAFDRLADLDNDVMTMEAARAAVAKAFREMAAARASTDEDEEPAAQ